MTPTDTCDNSWKVYVAFYRIFCQNKTSKITDYCDDRYLAIWAVSQWGVMMERSREYNKVLQHSVPVPGTELSTIQYNTEYNTDKLWASGGY